MENIIVTHYLRMFTQSSDMASLRVEVLQGGREGDLIVILSNFAHFSSGILMF